MELMTPVQKTHFDLKNTLTNMLPQTQNRIIVTKNMFCLCQRVTRRTLNQLMVNIYFIIIFSKCITCHVYIYHSFIPSIPYYYHIPMSVECKIPLM
jgi:hypothetical protein